MSGGISRAALAALLLVPAAAEAGDAVKAVADPVVGGTRQQFKVRAAIVVLPSIPDELRVTHRGTTVTWEGLRGSIADALKKALSRNLPDIGAAPLETKKGLEFVVDRFLIDESDFSLKYSAIMSYHGTEAASMSGTILLTPRVINTSVYSYKKAVRQELMIPGMKELLEKLAVEVHGNTIMSQKLEDNGFWRGLTSGAVRTEFAGPAPQEPPTDEGADSWLAALRSEEPERRREAAQALGELKSRRAVKPLVRLLADADRGVRASAADALGAIGDGGAVSPLLQLLSSKDALLRAVSARALGALGSTRARIPLRELLASEKDPRVRAAADKALREIDSAEFIRIDMERLGHAAEPSR